MLPHLVILRPAGDPRRRCIFVLDRRQNLLGTHFLRLRVNWHIFTGFERGHKVLISDDDDCHVSGPSVRPLFCYLSLQQLLLGVAPTAHCTVVVQCASSDRNCSCCKRAAHNLTDIPDGDASLDDTLCLYLEDVLPLT